MIVFLKNFIYLENIKGKRNRLQNNNLRHTLCTTEKDINSMFLFVRK